MYREVAFWSRSRLLHVFGLRLPPLNISLAPQHGARRLRGTALILDLLRVPATLRLLRTSLLVSLVSTTALIARVTHVAEMEAVVLRNRRCEASLGKATSQNRLSLASMDCIGMNSREDVRKVIC